MISVKQARNPNFVRNDPVALGKIYRKYGVPLPAGLAAAVAGILGRKVYGQRDDNPRSERCRVLGAGIDWHFCKGAQSCL
ncbi:Endothiapepsin [Madurella mycetomatis]|uniref:Endothiapepsin n=1 Tax=Madurella mycetomatis TaxID=100816 RepID=A0A175WJ50_9PEZI|nr:Endothiapepsin [Madurella mycetomatis]